MSIRDSLLKQRQPPLTSAHLVRQPAFCSNGGVLAADYFKRRGFDWIGEDIPREDARWVGSCLDS